MKATTTEETTVTGVTLELTLDEARELLDAMACTEAYEVRIRHAVCYNVVGTLGDLRDEGVI